MGCWRRSTLLLLLLSVSLLHLLRLLLVLPLHLLHLGCAGFLLRHLLVVLRLALRKLLVLLLLLGIELFLLLAFRVGLSISSFWRRWLLMRRDVRSMDRRWWPRDVRRTRSFICWTRSGFIPGTRGRLLRVRLSSAAIGGSGRMIGSSCRFGRHNPSAAKRCRLGRSRNRRPAAVHGSP